ncbi:cytochrome c oxidase subunit II [Nocardioides halotolerans]|uniref:aa3-type cytochrome oxidase subunit II n=1 Tax=Nocardioides halotolerans TaxID=433660 RepID=UPI00068830BF|nr:cytochrome c oxidase subunit II [Nocardioides halotolerans]
MGLQRVARWAVPLAGVALLASGCSEEGKRLAMPDPASEQGEPILALWQGAWIAALATGIVVWGLIFFVVIRYRRRSDDEIPVQTRYNLPLEIFYTIAPVVMVIVFFSHTVHTQNLVLEDDTAPDNIIEVTGQQWSWTFNYGVGDPDNSADDDRTDDRFPYDSYVHDGGTAAYIPELWLPVDETTRFNLHSPDVIHDFGVPSFLMRMDVVPGRVNHYVIKPTREGVFKGKCYELCGVYHSRMLFEVHVVSREEYDEHLQELEDAGLTSDKPLLGGENADTTAGEEATSEDPEGEGK